ncbi:MAG: PaaI family thioesterase, partial [Gammaproteobacteria bacterium]|nr:PaaI family thioesterase [Gammaproteobacteria bacterium]
MTVTQTRIQDYYPTHFHECFGCGARNRAGMCLSTFLQPDDSVVTHWQPSPRYAGASNTLHGGITAVLMDEVAGAAAFVEAHRRHGVALGAPLGVDFVTANLSVNYLKPVLIDKEVAVTALISESAGR